MKTKTDLDAAQCGCGAESEVMYLHGRCHVAAPHWLIGETMEPTTRFRLECVVPDCGKAVATVFGTWRGRGTGNDFRARGIFSQDCHWDSAVRARYRRDSGVVEIECYECKQVVGEIVLAPQRIPNFVQK